jgi:hypothetical protein
MLTGTSYQWMKDGVDITGQQSDMMIFSTLELSDAGVYKCRVVVGGNTVYSREITVNMISKTDEEIELFADKSVLQQNYPNPFNTRTMIRWYAPEGGHQTLKVYDILGKEVVTLVDEYKPTGEYTAEFNLNELQSLNSSTAATMFFCKLETGKSIKIIKMTRIQ